MLSPEVVFEAMVRRLASSEERVQEILKNRLYQHLSRIVAGMQEYTAAEALYTLSSEGRYDLVVLDTPPSRNALEFLEAMPEELGLDEAQRQCRAHTRKGTPCQRDPLPGRDYCPSHKHLEETFEAAEVPADSFLGADGGDQPRATERVAA